MRNHIETRRYVRPKGSVFFKACFALSSLFLLFGLSACGSTSGKPEAGVPTQTVSDKTLYVTNGNGGKLLAFDVRVLGDTLTVQGENIAPTRQFPDRVSSPAGLFLDRVNDTLYVANPGQNAIQIYDNASTLITPLTASRVISGDLTQLDQPFGLTFDATSGRLFVANKDGNSIVAFCIGTAGSGNIAPCNLLEGDLTQLDFPRALSVDTTRKILYISNMGSNSILVYQNSDTIGATVAQCKSDPSFCNIQPSAVIAPHTGTENVSKLELPFGIFIDNVDDRLYVANTGLNSPGVLIYEGASLLDGTPMPDRVLTGLSTLLTVPAGIDVDEATGRLSIINNNSPNNVNTSTGANDGSPSLLIFNDILTTCTTVAHLCNLNPDSAVGGDVSVESGTTLTHPVGIAYDPGRDITYVANTGGNNIIVYSVEGNTAPFKTSAGPNTRIDLPSSSFYDSPLDRLYVTNGGAGLEAFVVYDQVSTQILGDTAPSWQLRRTSNFERPMGFYIDKTRKRMLFLNASPDARRGLYVYDLTVLFRDLVAQPDIAFPTDNEIGPTGKTLLAPGHESKSFDGLSTNGGPTGIAVDELRGEVYVSDKTNNSVVVYDLASAPVGGALIRKRIITGFDQPSGLFLSAHPTDSSVPAVLYVTNNGEEAGALGDYRENTIFVFDAAETKGDGTALCPTTPCRPDRIISTKNLSPGAQNKLKAPIAPYVDRVSNRLYLINSASDQNAIFQFSNASTMGDGTLACVTGAADCADTAPSKVIIGTDTNLNFTNGATSFTGALVVSRQDNNETVYVGQPVTPLCASPCATSGAILVFGSEGKLKPTKIWTGGGGSFSTPEAMAVDSSIFDKIVLKKDADGKVIQNDAEQDVQKIIYKQVLYVVNQSTNTLSRLEDAGQLNVTSDPNTVKIDLTNIRLNRPSGFFVDDTRDRPHKDGNGNDVFIVGKDEAEQVFVSRDRLYVSNSEASTCSVGPCNAILVFNNASTFVDGATPNQTITTDLTTNPPPSPEFILNRPQGLVLNPTSQRLYVANTGADSVLIYNQADTLNGAVTASVALTGFSEPSDLTLDPGRDILYVLDRSAKEIHVFDGASGLIGGESATRTIEGDDGSGNNAWVNPSEIYLDTENDLLYLADPGANSVSIFTNASTAEGQAEKKTFLGDKTGLQSPSALTVGSPTP